jgi:pimeloyl-ACP methyl ester carboxylesterase
MSKIAVYFMPGLAASPEIFERIKLPADKFETILLKWALPIHDESLASYAERMTQQIKHDDPVLIGVSFGGILVQEMARFIKAKKVIIISSAKCNTEYPKRFKLAKATGVYKILPTSWFANIEKINKWPLGSTVKKRLHLYEKYLAMREPNYLDWAIKNVILWDRIEPDEKVIHIHGTSDAIFPAKYIKNFIPVPGGSHIMILNKYKWLNENLPKIILNDL